MFNCLHHYLLTYLLTPWSRVLLEKLTGSAASQKIPRIFGTWRFLTILTSARQMSLSWSNSIQFPQPSPTSWRSILIFSSHLRLGLTNGLFPSGFPTRTIISKKCGNKCHHFSLSLNFPETEECIKLRKIAYKITGPNYVFLLEINHMAQLRQARFEIKAKVTRHYRIACLYWCVDKVY